MPQQDQQYKRTATNKQTGERWGFDEATRKWVPIGTQIKSPPGGTQATAGFPITPRPGESYESTTGRAISQAKQEPGEVAAAGREATREAKAAIPYGAAGAATFLLPEGSPLWLYLVAAFSGAGAAGGGEKIAESAVKGKAPRPGEVAGEAVETGITKGVLPELLGRGTGKLLGKLGRPSDVPSWIRKYLTERGIQMTAGEMAGPGAISTAENVVGAVAVGTRPVTQFLVKRQDLLAGLLSDTDKEIAKSLESMPGSVVVREGAPRTVQEVAQDALNRMSSEQAMSEAKLVESVTGHTGITPAEAGDIIIQAVRKTYDATDKVLDDLYDNLRPQLADAKVTWKHTAPEARRFLLNALRSKRMGGSPLPPDLLGSLMKVAGVTKVEGGTIIGTTPVGAFDSAWGARRSFGKMIGRLESQGVITREDLGVLRHLYDTMTTDMMQGLPKPARLQFQQAMAATREVKSAFNSQLIQNMLREDRPAVAEKVFSRLMQSGNETDLKQLITLIGRDKEAVTATKRAAVDWLFKNSRNDEHALQLLEKRPGLRELFGKDYNNLRQELASRVLQAETPQKVLERKFLDKLTGTEDPSTVAKAALDSPAYAERLARLTGTQPLVHQDMAVRMFQELVDKSTTNGPFGSVGSYFDAPEFNRNWKLQRESFSKFLAPEVLANIDKMSEAFSKLTFEVKPGVAAKFHTLAEVRGASALAAAMVIGGFTGSMTEAAIAAPLASIYGPYVFIKAVLSPTFGKLLAEGLRVPVGTPAAMAWTARVLGFLGEIATSDTGQRASTQQVHGATRPPALLPGQKVSLEPRVTP
jgi:hypothetical protein